MSDAALPRWIVNSEWWMVGKRGAKTRGTANSLIFLTPTPILQSDG